MIDEITHLLLPAIEHLQGAAYWVAFFAALMETALVVGLLIPGSTLLLFLGALSANGHFDFITLLGFAVAGAIIGDNLNYWLGKRYGQRWMRNGIGFLKQEHFDIAHRFFDRHGARSIFLGRFVPTIKELIPFVAGTVNMRRRTFMFWNVLGATGWGLEWLGAGYLFARSINLAQLWLSRAGLLLAAILVLSLLLLWFKRFIFRYGQQWLRFAISIWHSIRTAVASNPEVVRLVDRNPRLFTFLAARFDRKHFSGLPLTLSAIAFLYVLALFGGIVEDLLSKDPIVAVDHNLAQVIATLRTADVVQVFIRVTELGMWQVAVPFTLITATVLWLTQRPWLTAGLLTSVVGSMVFTTLGKLAFHRPRPIEAVLIEHSYSFPSGHATIAVAFYGFLGYLLIRDSHTWRQRVNWLFVTLVVILLIGLSRIILGVHYLSDVWSGYLVGALWLIIGISLNEWLASLGKIPMDRGVRPVSKQATYGLIVVAVSVYVGFATLHQPRFATPAPVAIQRITGDPVQFLKTHVPAYTETAFGQRQLPLSLLLFAGNESALVRAFRESGWQPPGQPSLQALVDLAHSSQNDAHAPLPPAFWNGRINDLAFEKVTNTAQGKRVIAVQLWHTPYATSQGRVFVAVAKAFDGIHWGILRTIDPDLDAARDAVVASLQSAELVRNDRLIPFVKPLVGKSLTGNPFFSRGEIQLVVVATRGSTTETRQGESATSL